MPPDPAHDLRLGGSWTRWQRRKNDVIFAVATGALRAAGALPPSWLRGACALLGLTAWVLLGNLRRRTARNLQRAMGKNRPSSGDIFLALAGSLADTLLLLRGEEARSRLEVPAGALEVFEEGLAGGKGVILATAHLGPWERLGVALVEAGLPLTTVARGSYDPRFDALYRRLREERGLRVLYRGAPGFGAGLVRALKGNRVVGMPADLGGRGVRTQGVPFLGGRLPLAVGPAELAHRTGAALVVATPGPGERGLRVHAERLELGGDAVQTTLRLGAMLEARIRALPGPWPWMHLDLGEQALPVAPLKRRPLG
jgi:KDO2-lipid IV(A) lauroyltransferase